MQAVLRSLFFLFLIGGVFRFVSASDSLENPVFISDSSKNPVFSDFRSVGSNHVMENPDFVADSKGASENPVENPVFDADSESSSQKPEKNPKDATQNPILENGDADFHLQSFFKASNSALESLHSWARRRERRTGASHSSGAARQRRRRSKALRNRGRKSGNPYKQMAINKYVTVDQSGKGQFGTIQAAIDSIPGYNPGWTFVQINPGVYREKVQIAANKSNILLQGAGRDKTVIEWNDVAISSSGTANTATFTAWAPGFVARGISFKNTAPAPPPGAQDRQGVAVLAANDMQAFYSCGFYGAQDTLFDYDGRHYFRDCYIEGSIDVIFGHAQSIFRECELHSIAETYGSLAAHNRANPNDNTAFVFVDCTITGTGQVFLGRAWGPFSRIIYINTRMDNVIIPPGWYDWGVSQRQRTVYFAQYKCSGPGASVSGRVSWSRELNDDEASPFMHINFIDGQQWLSQD